MSRCLVLTLKRKTADEIVTDFDHLDNDELAHMREKLARWSMDYAEVLSGARPQMIQGFHNRTRMNWSAMS